MLLSDQLIVLKSRKWIQLSLQLLWLDLACCAILLFEQPPTTQKNKYCHK